MRSNRDVREHVGRVMKLVEGDAPSAQGGRGDRLLRSWQRSLARHNVDPARTSEPRVLTQTVLRERRDRLEALLLIGRQAVTSLHSQLSDMEYCVLLTDAEGATLVYEGVPRLEKELRAEGFRAGTCWSEVDEGTNGVGTTIIDGAPTLVHRGEHFRAHNITFTCSAAPIFAPDRTLLGILDASALYSPEDRKSQSLVFRLVVAKALAIENAYFAKAHETDWLLQLSPVPEAVDAQAPWAIAFDVAGTIRDANRKARADLLPEGGIPGAHLDEVFDCSAIEIIRRAHTQPGVPVRVRTLARGTALYGLLRAPARSAGAASSSWDAQARAAGSATAGNRTDPHARTPQSTIPKADHAPRQQQRTGLPQARVDPAPTSGDGRGDGFDQLAIGDPRLRREVERLRRLADNRIPILIQGETGTGKEAFARAIHQSSARRDRPFVALNCASIPEGLIESELFGYRPGAFTGARAKGSRGKILLSSGGTLFLDEIGDMPFALQSRLLRVIAEREVLALGAETPELVDLHVICATHRDLATLVRQHQFREDLYFRLNGARVDLPPLRERSDKEEVILRLLREEADEARRDVALDAECLQRLKSYRWPGNIRELRNVLRYACAVCDGTAVGVDSLPPGVCPAIPRAQAAGPSGSDEGADHPVPPCADARGERVVAALRIHHWRVAPTARDLGVSRATLYRWMDELAIVPPNRS